MKIIDVQPKEIHVTLEMPLEEIAALLDYFKLAHPLYQKVYQDSDMTTGDAVESGFIGKLQSLYDDLKKGVPNDS